MKRFIASNWNEILNKEGLTNFEYLWNLDADTIDTPNTDREGWSSVALIHLNMSDGSQKELILKRQLNHRSRTFFHPFRGIPTFEKELRNYLTYKRMQIPTMEVVYYEKDKNKEGMRAVLISEYLKGYHPLDRFIETWDKEASPPGYRKPIIEAVARFSRDIHSKNIQHNCLYPKHIFIRKDPGVIDVRVIDLENSRWRPLGNGRRVKDLESLSRRIHWKQSDCLRFFLVYNGKDRLDMQSKRLCQKIRNRTQMKLKRRGLTSL